MLVTRIRQWNTTYVVWEVLDEVAQRGIDERPDFSNQIRETLRQTLHEAGKQGWGADRPALRGLHRDFVRDPASLCAFWASTEALGLDPTEAAREVMRQAKLGCAYLAPAAGCCVG